MVAEELQEFRFREELNFVVGASSEDEPEAPGVALVRLAFELSPQGAEVLQPGAPQLGCHDFTTISCDLTTILL